MTFLDKSNDVLEKLKRVQILQTGLEEAKALKKDAQDCEGINRDLSALLNLVTITKRQNIPLSRLPQTETLVSDINGLIEKFKAQPRRETLVRGNRLTRIYAKLQDIGNSTRTVLNVAWRQFCEANFAIQRPEDLESTVAQTDENKELVTQYRTVFQTMCPILNTLPDNDIAFDKLHQLQKQLKDILIHIDFNVPDEVKAFLKAISELQGASLSYLTNPVVVQWLQEHNLMERYKIIRRM